LLDHHVTRLADHDIPLVLVNRRTSGVHGSVVVDDLRGSRMAVEHLVGLGHRRSGYVGLDADTDTAQRRRQGYLDSLAAADLEPRDDDMESAAATEQGGHEGISRLLEHSDDGRPPTAVFVASLMAALGVRAGLTQRDLDIPGDVSVIAFNDHPVAQHLAPPLTTVRMPNLAMGKESVRMLLAALRGQPVHDVMIEDDPELIVRASTAAPAAVTPVLARSRR
jgi:LacI family transcriptional regulator